MSTMPVLYIPHGAGPWPFMDLSNGVFGAPEQWQRLSDYLRGIAQRLPEPTAIVVITAHWETTRPTVSSHPTPGMLYDYSGFPPETYQLNYPAPGSPELAHDIQERLTRAGIVNGADKERGFDHGTFIPLMLMYPEARIPVVQLSLQRHLNPEAHLDIGEVLRPLREQGVLILGSGMSVHNMPGFRSPGAVHSRNAEQFDRWLVRILTEQGADDRRRALINWKSTPGAVASHQPSAEHLTPLFVVAGAAGQETGRQGFTGQLMGLQVSAFEFG